MAVVVVGDIDIDQVEPMIVASFSSLENPDTPTSRPSIIVDDPTLPEAASLADPEATAPLVGLFYMANR